MLDQDQAYMDLLAKVIYLIVQQNPELQQLVKEQFNIEVKPEREYLTSDKKRLQVDEWKQNNRERINAWRKEYYKKNKEKILAYQRDHYHKNKNKNKIKI